MNEFELQTLLDKPVNAAGRCTRLWRQNAGTFRVMDLKSFMAAASGSMSFKQAYFAFSRIVQGAPKNSPDLTGIVIPEGWRLECELKGPTTRHTKGQKLRAAALEAQGAVVALYRVDPALSDDENVSACIAAIDAAVARRRERGW